MAMEPAVHAANSGTFVRYRMRSSRVMTGNANADVHAGDEQGQEEHGQNLGAYGLAHLSAAEPDFLHNGKRALSS